MTGLKHGGFGSDVRRRGHPQPADQSGCQVGEDVTQQILGHDQVESLRVTDQLHGGSVDVQVVGRDVGILLRNLIENGSEEGERSKDVRLVDASDFRLRSTSPASQLERRSSNPLGTSSRDDLSVGR